VVRRAAEAGVEVLALSDHDSLDGVPEALEAAAAAGIGLVPAVEISAGDGDQERHLLGYGVDLGSEDLQAALRAARAERFARAERMAGALADAGLAVRPEPLAERRAAGLAVGRPHLAEAVLTHPANAGRLAAEGLRTAGDVLEAYLVPGAPGHRPRERPSVEAAIAMVHAAGGLAVWAHPFWDVAEPDAVVAAIDRYAALGLDGVEAFYLTHTEAQARLAHGACLERGLLTTGSSDFHGPEHPIFHRLGAFELHGLTPVVEAVLARAGGGQARSAGSTSSP
jgi:predicted metal-dependent phosphoesterase TrpH